MLFLGYVESGSWIPPVNLYVCSKYYLEHDCVRKYNNIFLWHIFGKTNLLPKVLCKVCLILPNLSEVVFYSAAFTKTLLKGKRQKILRL